MPFADFPVVPAGRMSQSEQPVLESRDGGLRLRPWRPDDAYALMEAFADPAIQRWHRRRPITEQEAVETIRTWNGHWLTETNATWAVTCTRDGAVLGRASLRELRLAEGFAECAYWVLPAARGGGVAARATAEMSRWALRDLGLHRLELAHSVANPASCRVAGKAGFRFEGTKRSALLHGDGWHDMHLHARVEDDA